MLTMQQFVSADNQQGTTVWIAWLAGLFDGEGSIGLYESANRAIRCWQMRVTITNTSVKLLDKITTILDDLGLAYYVRENEFHKNKDWKPRWQIIFTGFGRSKRFLEVIRPFLIDKATEADLLLEFIDLRFAKGRNAHYGDRELEIVELIKNAKQVRHLRD